MKRQYDHSKAITNPSFEHSDCYNCRRAEGGMCWIGNPNHKKYIAVTSQEALRCGYWYPWEEK